MNKQERRSWRLAVFSEKIKILEKLQDRSLALAVCGLRRPPGAGNNAAEATDQSGSSSHQRKGSLWRFVGTNLR
jgi:hypothetical protein